MGLSTALSSVGIRAEMGGSAFSRVMTDMNLAVSSGVDRVSDLEQKTGLARRELELLASNDPKGFRDLAQGIGSTTKELNKTIKAGRDLEHFSAIAGMSSKEFEQAFKENAVGAISAFIEGLGSAEDKGEDAIQMLEDLGVSSVRIRDTLLRTGGAKELFAEAIGVGNSAWGENIALTEEANERYATAESQLAMLKNRVVDAGIELGGKLAPSLVKVVDSVVKVIEAFTKLPDSLQVGIIKAALFTTAFGGILSLFGRSSRGFLEITGFFGDLGKLMGGTARIAEGAGESMSITNGIIGLLTSGTGIYVAGALAAVAIVGTEVAKHIKEAKQNKEELIDIAKNIPEITEGHENDIKYLQDIQEEFTYLNSLVGDNGDLSKLSAEQQESYLGMVEKMSQITPDMETFYNTQGQLVAGTREEIEKLITAKEREMELDKQKAAEGYDEQLKDHKKFLEDRESETEKVQKRLDKAKESLAWNLKTGSFESADRNRKEVEKFTRELEDLGRVPIEKINETVDIMSARVDHLSGSLEKVNPHLGGFDEGFKQIMENDPTVEGIDKADKAANKVLDIAETLEKAYNREIQLNPNDIKGYADELVDYGMEWKTVSGILYGSMTEVEGSEEKLALMNKTLEEFNKGGEITEGTSNALKDNFSNITDDVTKLDVELLKSIATSDKWAAAYLASQSEMQTGITELRKTNEEQSKNLPTWEVISQKDVDEQIKIAEKAGTDMGTTIQRDADNQRAIIKWLHEDLKLISAEEAQAQIEQVNADAELRLNELRQENKKHKEIIKERGNNTREGLREAALELEHGVKDIDDIWKSMDSETQDYFIQVHGIEDTEDGMKKLEELFNTDPVLKEFLVEAQGFAYVQENIEEIGEVWESLSEEEKVLVARMIGYGLQDAEDFQKNWNELDPEVKKFIAEAVGIEDVQNADEETMAGWALDPKVKMFVAAHDGLENVRIEKTDTDDVWKITMGDKTYITNERGAKEAREVIKWLMDLWGGIPRTDTKTMTIEQRTNRREFLYAPQRVAPSSSNKPTVEKYWTGTDSSKGGLAFVGEKGRELLIYPDGRQDMTGATTELRNLPRGTRIFSNPDTEKILAGEKIPKFAKGNEKPKGTPKPNIGNTSEKARLKAKAAADDKVKAKKKEKEQEKEILDILDAQIRRIQIKNDHLLKTRDLMEEQLALASKDNTVKGINQQLEITGNIMRENERIIKSFQTEQTRVHEMANKVRKEYSKYKIDTWFDANGEQTPEFVVQFNAAGSKKMQDEMKEVYGKVEKLKKAWMDADKELQTHIKSNEELKRSLEEIDAKMQSVISGRISDSKAWMEKRNFYGDWGEDSEVDGWDRMRDYINQYYEDGYLSYKQFTDHILDIDQGRFNAQQKLYDEEKKLNDERHAEEIKQYEERRDKWLKDKNKELQDQRDRLSALDSIQEAVVQIIRKRGEEEKKVLDKSHKSEMDSLEERHKKRKELYKEELDEYTKMIQGKIDALDEQVEEEDYLESLNKEREKANELQKQIDVLVLDDSLTARNKTIELRKELADQNESIAKMQQKKERDLLKKSLQDQLTSRQEDSAKKEEIADELYQNERARKEEDYEISKEFLERKYSDEQVYAEAKESIIRGTVEVSRGSFQDIYDAYRDFEDKFGKGMGILGNIIKRDFLDQLEQARQAIRDLEYEQRARDDYTSNDYDRVESRPNREPDRYVPPSRPNTPVAPPVREPDYGVGATKSDQESNAVNDKIKNDKNFREAEIRRTEQVIQDRLRAGIDVKLQREHLARLRAAGSYANGGKITETGMVLNDFHGSKSSPEWIFKDSQLKNIIKDVTMSAMKVTMPKLPNIPSMGNTGGNKYEITFDIQGDMDRSILPEVQKMVKVSIDKAEFQKRKDLNMIGQFRSVR